MATSTIKYDTYKTGSVTVPSGATNNLQVRQSGRVVTINGYVNSVTLTANTSTLIATISGVSRPSEVVRTVCGVAAAAYNHPADVAYASVQSDGQIMVVSTINGSRAVYLSVSYIV